MRQLPEPMEMLTRNRPVLGSRTRHRNRLAYSSQLSLSPLPLNKYPQIARQVVGGARGARRPEQGNQGQGRLRLTLLPVSAVTGAPGFTLRHGRQRWRHARGFPAGRASVDESVQKRPRG